MYWVQSMDLLRIHLLQATEVITRIEVKNRAVLVRILRMGRHGMILTSQSIRSIVVVVLAGGVGIVESTNFGIGWQGIANGQIHVDHHYIRFDGKKPGRVLYGDDGGVWISNNGGNLIMDKNQGYVATQFYCAAIHPDAGSPYIIGGTQDNNTMAIEEPGLSPARVLWGGDGVFCFIDQNQPAIQIVSSQGGNYGLSTMEAKILVMVHL